MDAIGEVRTEAADARRRRADEWGVPVRRVKMTYKSGSPGSFVWDFELLPKDS
ncbi:hypothetical protein [Ilumatobacter sp.]|uniref:hypothetical protein n=1 Tax=Ilumatobacter sp. TaxID=1967498 RepID=UPI003753B50E